MKKMRKVMALFVVVAMLFNMCPPSVAASEGIRQTQVSVGNADIQSSDDNTGDKSAPNQENTDTKTDSDKIDKDSDSGKNDEDASSTVSEEKEEVATSESVTESVAETSEVTTEALISTEETVDEQTKTSISKETDADDEEKNSSNIKEDKDKAVDEKSEGEDSDEDAKMPAFSETKSVDGVKITVDAGEDVFPKGVTLGIRKVSKVDGKNVDEAIDKIREDGVNVAAAYTFDVKVVDKDGNGVQPADGKRVKVSFEAEEVGNDNLTADIYHITGEGKKLSAEMLDSDEKDDQVTASTSGFSLYTVEFTYDEKQYVMKGDTTVALSDILDEVGLTGEVSEVEVSDDNLFFADKKDGKWMVIANKAFISKEWMKVTIDDVVYEIVVTDAQYVASVTSGSTSTNYENFSAALSAWNSSESGATLKLLSDVTTSSTISVSDTKTLDLNGYGIKMTGSGRVILVTSGASFTLKDSNTDNMTHKFTVDNPSEKGAGLAIVDDDNGDKSFTGGYITGGSRSHGGGVYVDGGTFNMSGGNIIGNKATNNGYYAGGGVALSSNLNSHFVMTGGAVLYNTSIGRGGGLGIPEKATADLSGSAEICYNYSSDHGAGVSSFGTLTISGNVKITNNSGSTALLPNAGSLSISGSPVIYDNEVKKGNIHLGDVKINVIEKLTEGAKLGVYKNDAGAFTTGGMAKDYASNFTSDNSKYTVQVEGNELKLATPPVASVTSDETTTEYDDLSAALSAWTDGSTLKLLASMTTSSTISVSGTKTLDLNGYGIEMTGSGRVILVQSGAKLTLTDSDPTTTHRFSTPAKNGKDFATLNEESGDFVINGGYITGGNDYIGGGVYVDGGTFTMDGGNIIGNYASNIDGVDGGGGVFLNNSATFKMSGGGILYNYAKKFRGGGLSIKGGAGADLSGNAEICYNGTNSDWGSGVSLFEGTLNISGNVKIMYNKGACGIFLRKETLNISGNPNIRGNINKDNNEVNIFPDEIKITIDKELGTGAKLGIYSNSEKVFTTGGKAANYLSCFTSDNGSYSVGKNADGQLLLGAPVTAIFNTDGGSAVESQTVASGSVVTKPDAPTKEGYTFVGWYKEDTFTTEWNFDSDTVTANTTIYAKWKQAISYTVTFKVLNGSWDDGNADDQTVTLTGYEGDTLKLTSDQIPEVGSKPDDTYKKTGSWDTTPSIDTTISEDTTYTYTYEQKASITPSVSMDGWTYGGAAKSPSVTGNTGNGEVTYTYAKKDTSDFSATVPSTAGDYTVKAVIAKTDDYLGGEVTADFTISKAEVTAPTITDKNYTGETQVADVAASGLYTVTTNNGGTDAGSYDVVLTLSDADNYKWADGDGTTKTLTFKIVSADTNTVTASIEGWTYGDSAKTPTSTATFGANTVVYTYSDAEDGDYTDTVPTKAGTWYVKASVPATDNYPAGEKTASFVIAKAEVTAPTITDKHYTGKNQIADVEESDLYTITTNNGGVNVGSYDVVLTLKDAANYKWSDSEEATKTLIFKIVPVDANIVTVSIDGWTYGEEAKAPTSSAEFGEDTVVYTYSDAEDGEYSDTVPTDAGTWYVKASVPETNDYSGSEAKASFKISKAALKVTAKDATITYGDKPKDNGVEYSGFVNEDTDKSLKGTLAYTIDYKQYGDVGKSYTIVPKGVTSKNYDITFAAGKLTVKPKSLTFTWEDASVKHVYNGKKQSVKVKAETVNDDVLTFTYSDNEKKNAGKYTAKITGIEGEKAANYTISDDESTAFCEWEIEKKKMSVTAKDVTVEYDEKEHGIEVKVTDPKSGYTITYGKEKGEYDSRKSPTITKEGSLTVYFKVEADNYITFTGSAKVTVKEKKEGTSSSSVEVKEGTPSVSVNGLDEEAKALQEGESADVNVTMSVEQVAEGSEGGDGITAIRNIAEGRMLTFFDIKVIKDVDSVKTVMDTTTNILEICIPYYHISEEGLAAYRYHGSSATRLTESDSRQDGTYRVDKITKKVYIYTNQFSIYAIGYTVKSSVNEEGDTVYDISGNIRYEDIDGMANLILYRNGEECKRGIAAFTGGVGTYQFEELKEGNYSLRITMDAGKDSFTLEIPIGDVSKQVVE